MKKSIKIALVFFLLLVNGTLLFGQETRLELGNKYFDQFNYKKAINLYEGMNSNQKTWQIYAKLGDCYYNTSRPETALKYYEMAIAKNSDINEVYLLKYALCLQSAGRPEEIVLKAFQEYYKKIGKTDNIGVRGTVDRKYAKPENLSINSKFSDFGSLIFNDTLYFSSSRENPAKKRRFNKRLYKWNEQPFLDIYEAALDRKNADAVSFIPPDSSNIGVNTIAHEASVAITNDGKTMYFSGGMLGKKNKLKYNRQGTSNLKLKRATRINNRWVETEADRKAMDFLNYDYYSVGNPALSPDNKRLFFVTCAPLANAKGQTDIYYVDIKDDGSYGKIKSIPGINTSGRESFPFISADGTLYFSSDGIYNDELGLGLLDLYKVENIDRVIQNKKKAKVIHLGPPFNSAMDDFAFFIETPREDEKCEVYAYFSSNREDPNAKGDDDIYRVKVKQSRTIRGLVTDSSTQKPLANASVDLIDAEGKVLKTVQVDTTGAYTFDVECGQSYHLRGSKDRYYDDLKEYNATEEVDSINLALRAYPCEISINHIEFDFESDVIRPDAKKALSELLEILLTNPDIHVRIESHTDSRGSAEYNLDLSERRAQNTKSFLIKKGVNESQIISAKGFGESCPVISEAEINKLPKDKREAEHERNRRSLFILDCNDEVKGCDAMH